MGEEFELPQPIIELINKYVVIAMEGEFIEDDVVGLLNDFLEVTGNQTKFRIQINYPDGTTRSTSGVEEFEELEEMFEEQEEEGYHTDFRSLALIATEYILLLTEEKEVDPQLKNNLVNFLGQINLMALQEIKKEEGDG